MSSLKKIIEKDDKEYQKQLEQELHRCGDNEYKKYLLLKGIVEVEYHG
jgi:hypothetical protein